MNPVNYIQRYIRVAEVLAIITAIISFAVWWHRHDMKEQDIGYQRAVAEYQAKLVTAQEAARQREVDMAKQLQEAQNAAAQRDQTIRTLSAATGAASNSLRDTINTIRSGVPVATADALRQSVDKLGAILNECQGRYRSVAEAADRAESDKRTLMDAWPK